MAENGTGDTQPKKAAVPTTYVVLQLQPDNTWKELPSTYTAARTDIAEDMAANALGKDGNPAAGVFKAVALSSWKGGSVFENEEKIVTKKTAWEDKQLKEAKAK